MPNQLLQSAVSATAVNKSAAEIISAYLTAIGGEKALKNITSVELNCDLEVQGQKLTVTTKQLFPNLVSSEISMNGTTVMRQAFNGNSGFQSQMGQKKEITAEELAREKSKARYF